ncbi:MAG TPA: Fur family transcriptional regulator [Streptomyces sp.]|uniref:Fur family transcriptional regulator n=1 Tax=Streptomyces sp. TaxID=1931 RepID=UPI002D601299|nr:Fur family transcriptional regulator [Streptomyces sp.]HZG03645.1 Fur family transcriptional regulator [Streptomyces sp.]
MKRDVLPEQREAAIQQLRDVGLRVTGPRLEVLQVLQENDHMEVEEIASAARKRLGTLTSQAVYEMLKHFLETGLVTKFDRPGLPAVFEMMSDPHHHALCTRCGRVVNVDVQAPAPSRKSLHGWRLTGTELVFKGECPDCR